MPMVKNFLKMSTYSKITDDEMKYFQFKARQCFLLQKEDHEWNEFCKQKKCTCCSCQPICTPKSMKSVSIQASTKAPIYLSQNSNSKNIEEKELPKSLNDIKDKLEKIDFTLSTIKVNTPKDNMINNITSESKLMENDSTSNFYTEHKKSLIRKSLINSLQRLHSFANQMSPRPLSTTTVTKKHKSFFLPHDLQKQRIVARKAYLASLVNQPKIQEKKRTNALNIKKEVVNKNNGEKQIHRNAHAKSNKNNKRQKSSVSKKKDETTLIQTEEVPEIKDENIETAVDNILEDLLSEEILALNRLRQRKMGKQINGEELKNFSIDAKEKTELKNGKKEIHFRLLSPESRNKIKQNPFFNLQRRNLKNLATSSNQDHLDKTNLTEDRAVHNNSESSNGENFSLFNSEEKEKIETKEVSASNEYRVIYLDPQLAKRISKQRYLYWQYLEKISRTKTNNFDPSALLNMVSESLLDDCILDVCQELGDMPSSLITDLYNQEFTPTI